MELSRQRLSGVLYVAPKSGRNVKMILELVQHVTELRVRYTMPAGIVCVPCVPSALVNGTWQVALPRGISVAIQGLSRNWPDVPVSTTTVPRYSIGSVGASVVKLPLVCVGSPFSLLLLSIKRDTNTAPVPPVPRLNAMPL